MAVHRSVSSGPGQLVRGCAADTAGHIHNSDMDAAIYVSAGPEGLIAEGRRTEHGSADGAIVCRATSCCLSFTGL